MRTLPLTSCIVSIPETDVAPAIVLYGGLDDMEGDWFLTTQRIPLFMRQKFYFILPKHYTNEYKDCIAEFRDKGHIDQKNISAYLLCGFSFGAGALYRIMTYCPRPEEWKTREWKMLGLIDPSPPTVTGFQNLWHLGFTDGVLDSFKDKIRCVYWEENWRDEKNPGLIHKASRFAEHLRSLPNAKTFRLGPSPGRQGVKHPDMPPAFFTQFKDELMLMSALRAAA